MMNMDSRLATETQTLSSNNNIPETVIIWKFLYEAKLRLF